MLTDNVSKASPCRKSRGKNAKFAQNLRENCAENALKLRAICAICAQIELKNCEKFARKCFVVATNRFFYGFV